MKKFLLLAVLVMALGAGYGVYRSRQQVRVGGPTLAELPPEQREKRRAEARQLTERVAEVARAARKHERKPFTIVATDEQLNTLLQDHLKTQNLPINNLRAALHQGQLVLQGDAEYKGVNAPATLTGTLVPLNGGLDFQVLSLTVSGFPAPLKWRNKLQHSVSSKLEEFFRTGDRATIQSVTLDEGKMTVTGVTG